MVDFDGLVCKDLWYSSREHRKFQEKGYITFPKFLTEQGLQVNLLFCGGDCALVDKVFSFLGIRLTKSIDSKTLQ